MNSIKLTKLQKKEMKAIVGGDKPKCSCKCSCECQGEDTTYLQNLAMVNLVRGLNASAASSESSSGTNPNPPAQ